MTALVVVGMTVQQDAADNQHVQTAVSSNTGVIPQSVIDNLVAAYSTDEATILSNAGLTDSRTPPP